MEQLDYVSLPKRAATYFRITYLLEIVISAVAVSFGWFIFRQIDWVPSVAYGLYALIIIWGCYRLLWYAERRRQNTWYQLYEDRLVIHKGVWEKHHVTIPMFRVQHVTVKRGPLLRMYALANTTFFTAGSSYDIPAVEEDKAEDIRDRVIDLAKEREEY
ncbi:PH domain-containing protein [Pontibacillus salicampi]|uniref:PH domain-containing protein n=1 Tax=Pontibacillus salicampi TaxID=1449801 RepID=A0ABV6LMA9_9BACI